MASKIKVDQIQTIDGSGTIALQNQLSGMTSASMPSGSVVKDSYTTYSTVDSTTSTTAAASGIVTTITPTSASNKMIINLNIATWRNQTATGVRLWLYRDVGGAGFSNFLLWDYYGGYGSDGSSDSHNRSSIQLQDTTYDSTSAVTYKVYFALSHGSGTVTLNQNSSSSSIYVQEIKA